MAAARLQAVRKAGYLAHALFACKWVKAADGRPQTMSITPDMVLRVNEDFVETLSLEQVEAVLVHEIWHVLRSHGERFASRGLGAETHERWNIAADMEINDDLTADGWALPEMAVLPAKAGLPDNKMAEWYFTHLPSNPAHGGGQDGGVCSGSCGNAASETDKEDGTTANLSRRQLTNIRRRTAEDVRREIQAKGRGTLPQGVEVWADMILGPPTVPWEKRLSSLVRRGVASVAGDDDYSWKRPHRRSWTTPEYPKVLMPSLRSPEPNIGIVLDTSGSMDTEDGRAAVSEIAGIMRSFAGTGEIVVYSCDSEVHSAQRVFNVKDVVPVGGGGTDMSAGIAKAAEARSDIIIVLTDGDTPWGDPPGRVPVVACIISKGYAPENLPDWLSPVHVPL